MASQFEQVLELADVECFVRAYDATEGECKLTCNELTMILQPQLISSLRSDDSSLLRDKETTLSSDLYSEARVT